jgi:hypothetical protein
MKEITLNQGEEMNSEDRSNRNKTLKTRLRLKKETIKELKDSSLKRVLGGAAPSQGGGVSCG